VYDATTANRPERRGGGRTGGTLHMPACNAVIDRKNAVEAEGKKRGNRKKEKKRNAA